MSVKNYYGTLLYVLVRACQIVVEDRYCTEPRDVILCMIMRGFVHVRLLYHKPLLSSLNFQAGVARNVRTVLYANNTVNKSTFIATVY